MDKPVIGLPCEVPQGDVDRPVSSGLNPSPVVTKVPAQCPIVTFDVAAVPSPQSMPMSARVAVCV